MSELLPISAPPVAVLDGDWLLCIDGEADVCSKLRNLARTILPPWFAVGREAGYLASEAEPGGICLVERALGTEFKHDAELALYARSLDLRGFQILRSALLSRAANLAPPSGVEGMEGAERLMRDFGSTRLVLRPVSWTATEFFTLPGADPYGDEAESELYPAPRARPRYELVWVPQPGKLRRSVVSFAARVDSALLRELARFISPWVNLLELGGFEQPTDTPGGRSAIFGAVQIYEKYSAEIVVDRFDAAEGAWSVLTNLLATFALAHPIISVEIN